MTTHSITRYLRSKLNFISDNKIINSAESTSEVDCPICGSNQSKIITYNKPNYVNGPSKDLPDVKMPKKYLCQNCDHLFSTWLDADLEEVSSLYSGIYDSDQLFHENLRYKYELGLMEYSLKYIKNSENISLLDFGCGPNTTAAKIMKDKGYDAKCCDILDGYPYDGDFYFKYKTGEPSLEKRFDVIVSIDVIEHLGNTLDSWKDLNRMLKPGGVMSHSFPSRILYSLSHEYCQNPFHNCLFSKKSLNIICEKTGFRFETMRPFDADVPFVFRFRKIREV